MHMQTRYVPGLQISGEGYIKLNTNENPYPPNIDLDIDLQSLRLYPNPNSDKLCKTIAEKHGVEIGNVFCGNGSDEVLALSFLAFFAGGDVMMPEVSYGFFPVWAQAFGAQAIKVPLNNWQIDWAKYSGNCIIANPNAPTGLAFQIDDIPSDGVVIIDEAYIDFANVPSADRLIGKHNNLLVVRTLSKSYSLAGLRVGYALGSKELIERLYLQKDCFNSYPIDTIAQSIATKAIMKPPNVEKIIKTRAWFMEQIKQSGWQCLDSQANFVFWEVENALEMYNHLLENKILVRYWDNFKNHLRVSIGMQEEMEKVLCCAKQMKQKSK